MTGERDSSLERYSRQFLFEPIGVEGQRRLRQARATLIGCGALGTVIANTLVRAGVGGLRICDRDYIELNNLQRQILFDEDDIARSLPKAVAAAEKLKSVNSDVEIEAVVVDVDHTNIERLAGGADVILDGCDNFETRYLINDLSVKSRIPWIYGAVIGASGLVMPIIPGETPCLRCVFESAPPPESSPTCDTAGVIGPAVGVVASFQATEALKLLTGRTDDLNRSLISIDVWSGRVTTLNVDNARADNACICCGRREFEFLSGKAASSAVTLCGRDAVQINPASRGDRRVDFGVIAGKIGPIATGPVGVGEFMLRARIGPHEITVFGDGRAIIKGTTDPDVARTLYSKYIGN